MLRGMHREPMRFLTPADLPGPSGGLRFNQRVFECWDGTGRPGIPPLEHVSIPGAWPDASAMDRAALAGHLLPGTEVLIDGIIASAAPDEVSAATAAGCRVAVLVHLPLPAESGLTPDRREQLHSAECRSLHAAQTVVATSQWAADDLIQRYRLPRVHVALPGTDPAALARGSDPPVIFFLGALTPRKNPSMIVQALSGLLDLPWQLVLAGPSPDSAYLGELHQLAEQIQQKSTCPGVQRVRICGPLHGVDLQDAWHRADLLVLPSLAETYGMVITEALAHGIPAMVSAGTGSQDALTGVGTPIRAGLPVPGAAIPADDPQQWAHALASWLTDTDLRQHWRSSATSHRDTLQGWTQTAQDLQTALGW